MRNKTKAAGNSPLKAMINPFDPKALKALEASIQSISEKFATPQPHCFHNGVAVYILDVPPFLSLKDILAQKHFGSKPEIAL